MPSTPTSSAATAPATYTTIPISGIDVISRSTQNLSASLSRCRPWPEFLATTAALDFPHSFSAASLRFRRNAAYFSVNYAVIITGCAAVSLIGSPIALITIGFVFFLWLILHFFREDPLLIWGHHVSDWAVILCLVLVSVAGLWITGPLNSLSTGISVGLLISVVHGVLRNPEGLFLDENDAVSSGLIVSNTGVPSTRAGGIPFNPPLAYFQHNSCEQIFYLVYECLLRLFEQIGVETARELQASGSLVEFVPEAKLFADIAAVAKAAPN